MIPTNNVAIQKAWVVDNIEQAALNWSNALNIGPFYLAEYSPEMFTNVEYRGGPGTLHMKTAIAYAGEIQIELVQPVVSYPCAFFDTVKEGNTGFHHLCYWSDDFDKDLKHYTNQGFTIANQAQVTGGGPRFAYIDASDTLGCMIELLERNPATEKVFNTWRSNAKNWEAGQAVIVTL